MANAKERLMPGGRSNHTLRKKMALRKWSDIKAMKERTGKSARNTKLTLLLPHSRNRKLQQHFNFLIHLVITKKIRANNS